MKLPEPGSGDDGPTARGSLQNPDWDKVIALAWRPAWSIRSRRGALALLAACWRRWRARQ